MTQIFIEAESFYEKGGWVVDTQSMEMIHSAYLMAHGMDIPYAGIRKNWQPKAHFPTLTGIWTSMKTLT